jgi:hypothetical protein
MLLVPDITGTPPVQMFQRAPTRSGECPANQKKSPQAGWDARHCRSFSCASATHSWGQHQKRGGGGHGHRRSPGPEPAANIGTGEDNTTRESSSKAPGNGGNGSPQTLSVFLFFGEVSGDPLLLLPGERGLLVCAGEVSRASRTATTHTTDPVGGGDAGCAAPTAAAQGGAPALPRTR